jgi:hypothetical protein
MINSGNDNDLSTNNVNPLRKHNWPHVAIVGCMVVSLGTAVVTGLKKSTTAHIVSSLCFVGTAMLHLFIHKRQLSHKVKTGLRRSLTDFDQPQESTKPSNPVWGDDGQDAAQTAFFH